jgi:general secretion pathway protein E
VTTNASAEFLDRIPHAFARRHLVLSEGMESGVERLRIAESTRPWAVHNVGVALGRGTMTRVEDPEIIAAAVDAVLSERLRQDASDDADVVVEGSRDVSSDLEATLRETERDLLSTHGKAPAVRLVDLILFEALLRSASDVHVQPVRSGTLVRYRLDGVLHTVRELPLSAAAAVVSRIKVMARLDVAEVRAPQDGRATVTIGGSGGSQAGRRVDLRISTLPSTYGERIVIRLLDPARSAYLLNFAGLGMPAEIEREYLRQCSRTSGIVLATGPTGSGKTTTLYTTLAWISSSNAGSLARGCELNMMTVEDPVEYDLSGGNGNGLAVSQTQVDPKKNVTFRERPAAHSAAGSRRDYGRRDPGPGDGTNRGGRLR